MGLDSVLKIVRKLECVVGVSSPTKPFDTMVTQSVCVTIVCRVVNYLNAGNGWISRRRVCYGPVQLASPSSAGVMCVLVTSVSCVYVLGASKC